MEIYKDRIYKMENRSINIEYKEYGSWSELDKDDLKLLEAAYSAANASYAPYSKFNVGAAVLLGNGEILCGCNQENSAFPSGLCAERVALFHAGAKYPQAKILAIAVTAIQALEPTYPCGACRQVMVESEKRSNDAIKLIIGGKESVLVLNSCADILPFAFVDIPGNR